MQDSEMMGDDGFPIQEYIVNIEKPIYPEAHIWPYYTKIRPFKNVSFAYPVNLEKPVYCMTNTYQSYGKKKDKIKIINYIDGPFYANKELSTKEQKRKLENQKIFNFLMLLSAT